MQANYCVPMTPGWPSGTDHVAYDKLPELLWRGSAQHARVVYELYPGDDGWDAQRLAISIGTAVELLLKHALALQSFHLLPDKYAVETALTLDGKGTPVSHLPQMATVAGTPLVERANKLWELKWGKEDFDLVFRVRNTALHLGVASTQSNKDAVEKMVLLTDRLFTHLGTDTAAQVEYWGGEDAEKFVRAIVDKAISEAKVRYEQLLRRAKDAYEKLTESLLEVGKAEVIKQFADVLPTLDSDEEAQSHVCPACGNMGWVVYEVDRGLPMVEYEEYGQPAGTAYVEREGSADRFECGVCRLKLDRREFLVEAGVALEIELEPDDATEEEINDYEASQVDAYIDDMIDQARGK